MLLLLRSKIRAIGSSLCRARCPQTAAGWPHTMKAEHAEVQRHTRGPEGRLSARSSALLTAL